MRHVSHFVVVVAAIASLSLASVSVASSATQSGYAGPGGNSQGEVAGSTSNPPTNASTAGSPTNATRSSTGSLPFTGYDVALVLGVGSVLLLAGFGMRRLTRGGNGPAA